MPWWNSKDPDKRGVLSYTKGPRIMVNTPQHRGIDLTGAKFSDWTILGFSRNSGPPLYRQILRVQCICGKIYDRDKVNIITGASQACRSCLKRKYSGKGNPNSYSTKDITGSKFGDLRYEAKLRSIEFSVTIGDLQELWDKQQGCCALSGVPIVVGIDASLDRIDSNGIYELTNVQWVHKNVNFMKGDMSQAEFIELSRALHRQAAADKAPALQCRKQLW